MKKNNLKTAAAFLLSLTVLFGACSETETKNSGEAPKAKSSKTEANLPNYRYVDVDTVLSKYNLAKDYNEEMLRLQTNLESVGRRHQNELQNFANNMQNKMQNNGYLSEASYRQDEKTLANMQNKAQQNMATQQSQYEQAAMNAQKAVNDSIEAFIEEYNKTRHYDAILFKAATLYINPALDITDEVVEGLNARYNKVKK